MIFEEDDEETNKVFQYAIIEVVNNPDSRLIGLNRVKLAMVDLHNGRKLEDIFLSLWAIGVVDAVAGLADEADDWKSDG